MGEIRSISPSHSVCETLTPAFPWFPSSAIQPAVEGFHLPGPLRAHAAAEDPGVLLWQHPLHEGLSEDRCTALQRWVNYAHNAPVPTSKDVYFAAGSDAGLCDWCQMARDYSQNFALIDVINLPGDICFPGTCGRICAVGVELKWFLFLFYVLVFIFVCFSPSRCLERGGDSEVVQWSPPS